jgi:hypothetical protein
VILPAGSAHTTTDSKILSDFRIRFIDDAAPDSETGEPCLYGELQLGLDVEGFIAIIGTLSVEDYERQWHEGLQRIVDGEFSSCLFTSATRKGKVERSSLWILYRLGDIVVFQEDPPLRARRKFGFTLNNPYAMKLARCTHTGEGEEISEW